MTCSYHEPDIVLGQPVNRGVWQEQSNHRSVSAHSVPRRSSWDRHPGLKNEDTQAQGVSVTCIR